MTKAFLDRNEPYWKQYQAHRHNASHRGIGFELTYAQWFSIWKSSKRIDQRGKRADCYVMARKNDEGAYKIGNVRIITARENALENYKRLEATRTPEAQSKRSASLRASWAKTPKRQRRARAAKGVATRTARAAR